MAKKVCVFLADGFEEIEGLTVVDLLRRAEVDVTTVSIMKRNLIHGAHGIDVVADCLFEEKEYGEEDMLVLPGGMPGTTYLGEHRKLNEILKKFHNEQKYLAAICAAPSVFGKAGFLKGRKATCYPSMENTLEGAEFVDDEVVRSGHIITSRGMGTAIEFSMMIIEVLKGKETAEELKKAIVYRQ